MKESLINLPLDAEFKLVLYPEESGYEIDLEKLEEVLTENRFIGTELSKYQYLVGDDFLSHLTFMGCSPNIELEPQTDDKPFCYIALNRSGKSQFIAGSNLKKARCTYCKGEVSKLDVNALCAHCDKPLALTKINWRKTAFVAKVWITIGNIYELEAIPNDALLSTLQRTTGVQWKPAYIRNATRRDIA